jgi:hypothetical protein
MAVCTMMDTINLTSQLIYRLPMVVRKIDSWLLHLLILLTAIGTPNPTVNLTNSVFGTLNVGFMVCPLVYIYARGVRMRANR